MYLGQCIFATHQIKWQYNKSVFKDCLHIHYSQMKSICPELLIIFLKILRIGYIIDSLVKEELYLQDIWTDGHGDSFTLKKSTCYTK